MTFWKSFEEARQCYLEQIDLLENCDFAAWWKLVAPEDGYLRRAVLGEKYPDNFSIYNAWNHSAENKRSLFALLPAKDCGCATQIETNLEQYKEEALHLANFLLHTAPFKVAPNGVDETWQPTRADLEEIMRRQLMAHFEWKK